MPSRKRTVALLGLVFVSLVLTACNPFKAPIDAAKSFLGLLRTDAAGAYESTHPQFKTVTSLEQLEGFLVSYPQLAEVASSQFTDVEIANGNAELLGTLTFDDGSTSPIQFIMIKDGDVWKVAGFDLNPVLTEPSTDASTETSAETAQ